MFQRSPPAAAAYLLVEDDPLIHRAVRLILRPQGAVHVATTVSQARECLDAQRFSIVLVDLGLPDGSGMDVIAACRVRAPATPVLVLTVATAWPQVEAALRAGASGYLLKEDLVSRLPGAIHEACRGGVALSAPIARGLVAATLGARGTAEPEPGPQLSERETEVLRLLASAFSYEQIAQLLGISANTVRTYVRSLYDKLGVHNRTHAIAAAKRIGIA